jgi:hypothetical protein
MAIETLNVDVELTLVVALSDADVTMAQLAHDKVRSTTRRCALSALSRSLAHNV